MMYEVTEVTTAELPQTIMVAKGFEKETAFVKVNYAVCVETYTNILESGMGTALVLKKDGEIIGGLGVIKYPDLHNGTLTAVETFWFVDPQQRGKGLMLLDAFEKWADENGCEATALIHMVDSYPEVLERLYRIRGYKLAEKHYVKRRMP